MGFLSHLLRRRQSHSGLSRRSLRVLSALSVQYLSACISVDFNTTALLIDLDALIQQFKLRNPAAPVAPDDTLLISHCGALDLAKTLERRRCGHHPDQYPEPLSTEECMKSVVDPKGTNQNKHRYVVASQSQEVRRMLRGIKGVPLIYIKRSVMILEPMADESVQVRAREERGKFRAELRGSLGKRKRDEDDEDDEKDGDEKPKGGADSKASQGDDKKKKKKGYGRKEPNPLSVQKTKKQEQQKRERLRKPAESEKKESEQEGPAKRKRRRKAKTDSAATGEGQESTAPVEAASGDS